MAAPALYYLHLKCTTCLDKLSDVKDAKPRPPMKCKECIQLENHFRQQMDAMNLNCHPVSNQVLPKDCTHLLINCINPNQPLLLAIAKGAWVLHPSYILDSATGGQMLPEASYEWCVTKWPEFANGTPLEEEIRALLWATRHWRQKAQLPEPVHPFSSCRVAFVHKHKDDAITQRRKRYTLLIKYGGGTLAADHESPTHVISCESGDVYEGERYPTYQIYKQGWVYTALVDPVKALGYEQNFVARPPLSSAATFSNGITADMRKRSLNAEDHPAHMDKKVRVIDSLARVSLDQFIHDESSDDVALISTVLTNLVTEPPPTTYSFLLCHGLLRSKSRRTAEDVYATLTRIRQIHHRPQILWFNDKSDEEELNGVPSNWPAIHPLNWDEIVLCIRALTSDEPVPGIDPEIGCDLFLKFLVELFEDDLKACTADPRLSLCGLLLRTATIKSSVAWVVAEGMQDAIVKVARGTCVQSTVMLLYRLFMAVGRALGPGDGAETKLAGNLRSVYSYFSNPDFLDERRHLLRFIAMQRDLDEFAELVWLKALDLCLVLRCDQSFIPDAYKHLKTSAMSLRKLLSYHFFVLPLAQERAKGSCSRAVQSGIEPQKNSVAPKIIVKPIKGAEDVNKIVNARGQTRIFGACHDGKETVVAKHLRNGADVTAVDYDGWTPLHEAVESGDVIIVNMLLDCDEEINGRLDINKATDHERRTSLHAAVSLGHVAVVRSLLNHGADISVRNLDEQTPLDIAVEIGHDQIIQLLLSKTPSNDFKHSPDCSEICIELCESLLATQRTHLNDDSVDEVIALLLFHYQIYSQHGQRQFTGEDQAYAKMFPCCLRALAVRLNIDHKTKPRSTERLYLFESVVEFSS